MFDFTKKIYAWASQKANSRFSALWIGVIFFLELFLFLPMDAILLLFCLENPAKRYQYATMATISSVACGFVGYLLGFAAWEALSPYILDHFISSSFFERLSNHYQQSQHAAVFVGSLLPIPFKAISVTAGVCGLAFAPFLGAVMLARGARFFLIARAVQKWGLQIKTFVDKHFHRFLFAVGLKILLTFSFFWALA